MNLRSILLACLTAARGTVADTIGGQICQELPFCEPDLDHDPLERRRLGPASPPKTLPQPLNRRNGKVLLGAQRRPRSASARARRELREVRRESRRA